MKEKSIKIQYWLSVILGITSIVFLVTTWQAYFFVSPLVHMNLALLSAGLYGIQMLRDDGNRKREVYLLAVSSIFITLTVSTFIYNVWSFETIFDKQGITKMTITLLLGLSLYLAIAYVRARITYKRVKGNQRHNETWQVSSKEMKKMEQSSDIYINLGLYYETDKD